MKDKILTAVFGVPQERIDALRVHNMESKSNKSDRKFKCLDTSKERSMENLSELKRAAKVLKEANDDLKR